MILCVNITIESKRLLFHKLSIEDHQYFHKLVTNKLVRRYLFDDLILTEAETESLLQTNEHLFKTKSLGLWKIIEKKSLIPVGVTGLWFFFEEPQAQLLYILSPEHTGKGYATEASAEVIKYALTDLNYKYIDASFDTLNIKSGLVCERLGMMKFKETEWEGKNLLFYRLKKIRST
jgi:[ribosomal protein S5]-alanine N-acetyltransferase